MATPIINEFSQFSLDETEQRAGHILTNNQLMSIQNLRAEYAVKRIKLVYTPESHQQFLQQEAEITGWMNCLTYLIECHEIASTVEPVESDGD